jgi:hypothetical protein
LTLFVINGVSAMPQFLTASQVAERLGVRPRDVSDAFYGRQLDPNRCQTVGEKKKTRLIPVDMLDEIRDVMVRLGHLQSAPVQA